MSVRKIRNSWYVDIRFNRKRHRLKSPLNTKAGAQEHESLLRQKLARGEPINNPKEDIPTFEKFAWNWYDVYALNNNKPSEQRQKEYTLRVHLIPFLGKRLIIDISVRLIEEYKSIKIRSGLKNKTINNHLAILMKCLNTAYDWEVIDKVPRIKKLKVPPQEAEFLSEDECEKLLEHSEGVWHEMLLLGLKTGLRLGEITGLDWSAVDLNNKRLTVVQALVRNEIVSPKSNKIRHIPLTQELCEVLSKRQKKKGYVFVDEEGNFLRAERCRRNLHYICKKAGMEKVKWHTLRHSFASHLIQRGAHQIEVQRLLGHSDIQTTMRYSHLAPSSLEQAINLLEGENFGQRMGNGAKNASKLTLELSEENIKLLAKIKQKQDTNPVQV